MRTDVWPQAVTQLEYMFDDWRGDVLLESFPCFIATDEIVAELEAAGCTGFTRRDLEVSWSELFVEMYPGMDLPPFVWLDIFGEPGVDDLGLTPQAELVISERVYSRLVTRLVGADYEVYVTQDAPGLIGHYAVVRVRRSASTVDLGIDGREGVVVGVSAGIEATTYAVEVDGEGYSVASHDVLDTGRKADLG